MQTRRAKERVEGPKRIQVERTREGSVTPNDPSVGKSIQENLIKLAALVEQFSTTVTDLQARSDVQIEARAARHPVVSTPEGHKFGGDCVGTAGAWVAAGNKETLADSKVQMGNARMAVLSAWHLGMCGDDPCHSGWRGTSCIGHPRGIEQRAWFPVRRRSPVPVFVHSMRGAWDWLTDPSGRHGTPMRTSVVDRDRRPVDK